MKLAEANVIVEAYVNAVNNKNWDKFSLYSTPDVTLQTYQRGNFQWQRKGIKSLNDHAQNVMLKIVPDFRVTEIMHMSYSDSEITLVVQLKGTVTGKADIGNYLDSNREVTNQEFQTQLTNIFVLENSKVTVMKNYMDLFDVMLAMNVIKFVEDQDTVTDYIQKIIDDGLL